MFTPRDWYWYIGADRSRAYSSARGIYVASDDAALVRWLAGGAPGERRAPTVIDSEASLGECLAPHRLRPDPAAAGVLDGFQDAHAKDVVENAAFKIMLNHENRLRAVERALGLNGSPANLQAAQAKAMLKALM
jgi:hypothetical protein